MYVELVWDIHFPGKLTRGEEKENRMEEKDVKDKKFQATLQKSNVDNNLVKKKIGHDHSIKAPSNSNSNSIPIFQRY